MTPSDNAALHDAYAATYDIQVQAYECHVAEVLFGLCYTFVRPGERLLDVGIGSGLSAELFARAGLEIHGMDFSTEMLELCRAKGFAAELKRHDLADVPWPYTSASFDHLVCCGVLHFVPELDDVIGEAARVLVPGGMLAFTTRVPTAALEAHQKYDWQEVEAFEIFSHSPAYTRALLVEHAFDRRKIQRCSVGDDQFHLWVAQLREAASR